MIVIVFLLSISLFVGLVFLCAYLWSARNGQFDDDYAPARRIFFEHTIKKQKTKK
jgi:cbb3-type cytochrome oxidase maturation protein